MYVYKTQKKEKNNFTSTHVPIETFRILHNSLQGLKNTKSLHNIYNQGMLLHIHVRTYMYVYTCTHMYVYTCRYNYT